MGLFTGFKTRYKNFILKQDKVDKLYFEITEDIMEDMKNIYLFDSMLRIFYSVFLLKFNGFLLHSSGIISNGKSFIFCGKSGAGKTTIAKKASNFDLLSDEIVAIRKIDNFWHAFGTPFRGEINKSGRNLSSRIKSVFFLNKSNYLSCEKLSKKEVLENLMQNVLFFINEHNLKEKVFNICCDFAEEVNGNKLSFALDDSINEFLNCLKQ